MSNMKILICFLIGLMSIKSFSQYGESIVYFEDGTTKKWNIKNIAPYKYNRKFKKPISRIELQDKNSNKLIVYENIVLKKRKKEKIIFVRIIYEGTKVNLYSRYILHNGDPHYGIEYGSIGDVHYAKKKNDKYANEISLEGSNAIYGNRFKKNARKFFSDCPKLVELIDKKEIKNKNKIKAFEFYDNNCN